jgi:hypothetical protein
MQEVTINKAEGQSEKNHVPSEIVKGCVIPDTPLWGLFE